MKEDLITLIGERKDKLENIKNELKKKFIGIDDVINKIIDNISLWYLMPEIQFKPLIVNLWGITGVGKTDLVRNLVKLLGFSDKFIEIQMDMKLDYSKNIENFLEDSGIDNNEPAILLLDEIQRYRTINENGDMIENKYFNDIWMLLSDGRFQNNSQRRHDVMQMLLEELYWKDQSDNSETPEENETVAEDGLISNKKKKNNKMLKYHTSYWTANRFKKILNLQISAEEIMKMNFNQRMELMENTLKTNTVNEGKSYEKLLIFISGNIDEAFKMADDVEDSESDADILHDLSKRVNIIHIKSALTRKFKPEQIARFGNNHVIYPTLNKKSYDEIIKINSNKILDRIYKRHGIKIDLDDNIYEIIYRNGVFPAQGVRPAISTVFNILGSNLPHFLYHALVSNVNKIKLTYDNNQLCSVIDNKKIVKNIILDIDNIKNNKSIDERMLVLVHELGHALIYAILFNTPPKQININSSGFSNGFVVNHDSIDNKTFIKNKIAVYLAGICSEEIVFGDEFKSNGASMDIEFATNEAGKYVRAYGMDGFVSRIAKQRINSPLEFNYSIDDTNGIIENILIEEKKRTTNLLNQNLSILKMLIKHTIDNNMITISDFIDICNKNGLKLVHKEINEKLVYKYEEILNKFLN